MKTGLVFRHRDSWHKSRSAVPGWQGAPRKQIGHLRPRNNAVRQDAPPGKHVPNHGDRTLGSKPGLFEGGTGSIEEAACSFGQRVAIVGELTAQAE